MPETERERIYREHQEERVREVTRNIAKRLRRIADDIDRIADDKDLSQIPDDVASTIAWGVANADLGSPARQLRELLLAQEAAAKLKQEKEDTA